MTKPRKTRKQRDAETLSAVSGESRAVIEAVLHIVAALKNQPGFDAEGFDAQMRRRMRELPGEMDIAVLVLAAAAELPREARPPRFLSAQNSALRQQ